MCGRCSEDDDGLELCFDARRGECRPLHGYVLLILSIGQYRSHSGPTKHRYSDEQYIEVSLGASLRVCWIVIDVE
jgi:hypothetical protein